MFGARMFGTGGSVLGRPLGAVVIAAGDGPPPPPPPFADYVVPLLSVRADTGSAADWTTVVGNLARFSNTDRWIISNNSAHARHYQQFDVLQAQHGIIDQGNAVVDLAHTYSTSNNDNDDVVAFVEFYDGTMTFLGNHQTSSENPSAIIDQLVSDCPVPPGTRTVRIGWQGARFTGSELSAYARDLACTIKTRAVSPWASAAVLFAEFQATATGLVSTLETVSVEAYSPTNDWRWQDVDGYMGGEFANSRAEKQGLAIPAGWAAKIAAGNVRALLRAHLSNANAADDAGIGLRFNNGSTNPVDETGRVALGTRSQFVARDMAVPSDTTSIDLLMEFWRDEGSASDGLIQKISVLLYETGA